MKVTVFQYKGKGYINLVPVVNGKILGSLRETIYPSCYHLIFDETEILINSVKKRFEK